MKRLQFEYYMEIKFSESVDRSFFTLKCLPMQDERQKTISCNTEILPDTACSEGVDGFGNTQIYGSIQSPHDSFSVKVCGELELLQTAFEACATEEERLIYRNMHGMNLAGPDIRKYYAKISSELPEDALEKALQIMHRLHRDFRYEKGCTDANTAAEKAFSQGCGVCQDYAHIYIALCILAGIPARYVAGLLIGEGESHAWVEVLIDGKWVGLDVTNDIAVCDKHIKFGHGRDAADCRINTGLVYGKARQKQKVSAITKLIDQ